MTNKLDDYRVVETISSGRFGQKALVCRVSDRRLFEWRKISYKAMDDALKEVKLLLLYNYNSKCSVLFIMFLCRWLFMR